MAIGAVQGGKKNRPNEDIERMGKRKKIKAFQRWDSNAGTPCIDRPDRIKNSSDWKQETSLTVLGDKHVLDQQCWVMLCGFIRSDKLV